MREFAELAFCVAGLDYRDGTSSPTRPCTGPPKSTLLLGDASKARTRLGWAPRTSFETLVREMVDTDCDALGVRLAKSGT